VAVATSAVVAVISVAAAAITKGITMRQTLLLAVLGAFMLPAPAAAFSSKDDTAKLFSVGPIEQAAGMIDEVKERYRKDLRIRTYATVPWYKDATRRVPKMDDGERQRFVTRWADADARYVDGVLILICKKPLEVRVVTHFRGRSRPITADEAATLENELLGLIKQDKNDEALLLAATFFHDRLIHFYGETAVNANFNWATLSSVLLALVGGWLALYFLHGFSEGVFRTGSAGINPLGLGAGVGILAGLRAVRAGLAQAAPPTPHVQDDDWRAPTG
jgi:hypothetical protein